MASSGRLVSWQVCTAMSAALLAPRSERLFRAGGRGALSGGIVPLPRNGQPHVGLDLR